MNRTVTLSWLLLLLILPGALFAQDGDREEGIPEGAAEPEHLKMRYEGNSRTRNVFQPAAIPPSTPAELNAAAERRRQMAATSLLKNYPVRNIGPTVMSGRVVDVAVNEQNPKIFYVGYASGGVFRTVNNGNTFEPIFDHQRALGIGDLALAPSDPNILWVGTGENNASRSSYAGAGVYKSTDAGKSWQFAGLDFTQHIGRVVVHPKNPDVVWVAAIGALYAAGPDRGLYKTTDGGKNWKKTLFVNDSTGVIDLVINPQNPDQLWAATWQRLRNAGNFVGNGTGSGIYVSDDGGETWQKSTGSFPEGRYVGRIGLDVCLTKPNILYAVLDNQEETRKEKKKDEGKDQPKLRKEEFMDMNEKVFLELPNADLDTFLVKNNFPAKYNANRVKEDVRKGRYKPVALNSTSATTTTPTPTCSKPRSRVPRCTAPTTPAKPGARSIRSRWTACTTPTATTSARCGCRPATPTGYYLGRAAAGLYDGGKTYTVTDTAGRVHADHHAMWINPETRSTSSTATTGDEPELRRRPELVAPQPAGRGQFYT
jgi:photosystem II stability/assembly factor-like uncharacterized protein